MPSTRFARALQMARRRSEPAVAGACLTLLLAGGCAPTGAAQAVRDDRPRVMAASDVEAGRYLVIVGGCNDCHTADWNTTGGATPEAQWLTGSPVGWRGPWGTTYPSNLRLIADGMDEDAFVKMLHTRKDRPPMPWMNVNRMHEADARAIYRFLKTLGPAGRPMPAGLPPGEEPATPFIPIAPPTAPTAAG
jgi:mono/diheme cytochrome c family protein